MSRVFSPYVRETPSPRTIYCRFPQSVLFSRFGVSVLSVYSSPHLRRTSLCCPPPTTMISSFLLYLSHPCIPSLRPHVHTSNSIPFPQSQIRLVLSPRTDSSRRKIYLVSSHLDSVSSVLTSVSWLTFSTTHRLRPLSITLPSVPNLFIGSLLVTTSVPPTPSLCLDPKDRTRTHLLPRYLTLSFMSLPLVQTLSLQPLPIVNN